MWFFIIIILIGIFFLGCVIGLPKMDFGSKSKKLAERIEFLSVIKPEMSLNFYWSDNEFANVEKYTIVANNPELQVIGYKKYFFSKEIENLNYYDKRFRDVLKQNEILVSKLENNL